MRRTEGRVHEHRQVAEGDAARRGPAVHQRAARRHEPRRPAADPPRVLRGARARAAGVLAATDRPPGAHRARAGAARLRDVDGGEARARSRVDRRPLRAPLPPHRRRDRRGACCGSRCEGSYQAATDRGGAAARCSRRRRLRGSRCDRRRRRDCSSASTTTRSSGRPIRSASCAGSGRSACRRCGSGCRGAAKRGRPVRGLTELARSRAGGCATDAGRARGLRLRTRHADGARTCSVASAATHALRSPLVPHARAIVIWNEANAPTYWTGTPATVRSAARALLRRAAPATA